MKKHTEVVFVDGHAVTVFIDSGGFVVGTCSCKISAAGSTLIEVETNIHNLHDRTNYTEYNETPLSKGTTMKKKLIVAKNHVYTYRARYAAATTLTVCVAVQVQGAKVWNEFLAEHNLLDEFYNEKI